MYCKNTQFFKAKFLAVNPMNKIKKESKMLNLIRGFIVASSAHRGQKDKGGKPYIFHPLRVAKGVESKEGKTVAILHDVIEDSDYTMADLQFLNDDQKIALDLLTHIENMDYFEYIDRIKTDPLATEIKLSDLNDNMNLSRIKDITDADLERLEKYKKAYKILSE